MKKRYFNKLRGLVILLLMVLVSNSCNDIFNNPLQDKETGEDLTLLLLDMNFFSTKITLHFVDDQTGQLLNQDILVSLEGDDVDKIVDLNGEKHTEFNVSNGLLELAVDPNISVNEENPVAFFVSVSSEDDSWDAAPTPVTINTTGVNHELIEVTYFSPDDGEDIDTEELKSASTTDISTPFSFKIASKPKTKLKRHSYEKKKDNLQYYSYYKGQTKKHGGIEVSKVNYKAFDVKITDLKFGYKSKRPKDNVLSKEDTEKTYIGSFSSINVYTVSEAYVKCEKGITINFNGLTKENASALFNYTVTFSDGSTQNGYLTLNARTNMDGSKSYLSIINNVSYPIGKPKATIEITSDTQYDITYDSNINNVCGAEVAVSVKPKANTYFYNMSMVVSCEGENIGAAPSVHAIFSKVGSTLTSEVDYSGGTVTLALEKNANYNLIGTIDGKSRTFGFSTSKANAQSFGDAIANSEEDLRSVTIEVTDPTATQDGIISVSVVYAIGHCPGALTLQQ